MDLTPPIKTDEIFLGLGLRLEKQENEEVWIVERKINDKLYRVKKRFPKKEKQKALENSDALLLMMQTDAPLTLLNFPEKERKKREMKKQKKNSPVKKSQYKGVSWLKHSNKWQIQVHCNGKRVYSDTHPDELTAALLVNQKCVELCIPLKNPELNREFFDKLASDNQNTRKQQKQTGGGRRRRGGARKRGRRKKLEVLKDSDPDWAPSAVSVKKEPEDEEYVMEEDDQYTPTKPKPMKRNKRKKHLSSGFVGVSWDVRASKWRAQCFDSRISRSIYCGLFDDAKEAALCVNRKCFDIGIALKNETIGLKDYQRPLTHTPPPRTRSGDAHSTNIPTAQGQHQILKSKYQGVSWCRQAQKWRSQCFVKELKKHIYCGIWADEKYAAFMVNKKCEELGIDLKNPNLMNDIVSPGSKNDIKKIRAAKRALDGSYKPTRNKRGHSNIRSVFKGVSWDKSMQKWKARCSHNSKQLHCGHFGDEDLAAQMINAKCKELGISLKNTNVHPLFPSYDTAGNLLGNPEKVTLKPENFANNQIKVPSRALYDSSNIIAVNSSSSSLGGLAANGVVKKEMKVDIAAFFNNAFSAPPPISSQDYVTPINPQFSSEDEEDVEMNDVESFPLASRINVQIAGPLSQTPRSRFKGVSWYARGEKWRGQLNHKGHPKSIYCGLHEDELSAAIAVNNKCRELGVPLKNPDLDSFISSARQKNNKRVKQAATLSVKRETDELRQSDYNGVSWYRNTGKWRGQIRDKETGRSIYCGMFHDERLTALAVNEKCRELNIPVKNPQLVATEELKQMLRNEEIAIEKYRASALNPRILRKSHMNRQPSKKQSQFVGVTWDENAKKWRARCCCKKLGRGQIYCGVFEDERMAGHMVNQKCVELCIPLKNPDLDPMSIPMQMNLNGQILEVKMENNYTTTHTPLTSFDPNTILPPFVSYLPRSGDPSPNVHLDVRPPPSSLNSFRHPSTSENMSENMEIENESTMEIFPNQRNTNKRKRVEDETLISEAIAKKRKLNEGEQLVVSIFKGVYFSRSENKWMAILNLAENRNLFLGYFGSQTAAAREVTKGALALKFQPIPNAHFMENDQNENIEPKSVYELVELNDKKTEWQFCSPKNLWTPHCGVFWNQQHQGWEVKLTIKNQIYCGMNVTKPATNKFEVQEKYYSNENNAAIISDILLHKYAKNPKQIDFNFPNRKLFEKSDFIGVYWNFEHKCWTVKRFWNDQIFWPAGLKLEHEQSAAYVSDFLQLHLYPNTPEIALNFSEGEKNKEIRDRHEDSLFKDLRTAPIDIKDASLCVTIQIEKEEKNQEVEKQKIEIKKDENIQIEKIAAEKKSDEDVVMKNAIKVEEKNEYETEQKLKNEEGKIVKNEDEKMVKNEEEKMVKNEEVTIVENEEEKMEKLEEKIDDVFMKNNENENNVDSINLQIEKSEVAAEIVKKKQKINEILMTPGSAVVEPHPPISKNLSQAPIILQTPPQTTMMNDVGSNSAFSTAAEEVTEEVKELKTELIEKLPSPVAEKLISIDLNIRPSQGLLETWNCEEVFQFLQNLHLEQYCNIFMENVVDGAVLISLDNEQCEALGIKLFHRPKLLRTIKEFTLRDAQEQN